VGKHSGPAARSDSRASLPRLLGLTLGITATLVAWGFLVWAAIDFGGQARTGEPIAWAFLTLATVGAAACLFVTLILGGKVIDAFRVRVPVQSRVAVPPGGRRARR
jgi:hypothetical protein